MKKLTTSIALLFGLLNTAHASWEEHLAWCSADTGVSNCDATYVSIGAASCIFPGGGALGRSCLIAQARGLAQAGQCSVAMTFVLACQCHNGAAQQEIRQAGAQQVCSWLTN
ncbi:hypothetical protein [Chitiniphilus eburneus]|uniref:hypothetical protein n=1 Tax=Chitiniphilus eburneus TaxID=2571148 RepID=UPI0035CF8BCE